MSILDNQEKIDGGITTINDNLGTLNRKVDILLSGIEGIPTGGTEGQVLAKIDDVDFNTHWVDQTGGHIINNLPQRPNLRFIGDGVTVSDNEVENETVVNIEGDGSGGAELPSFLYKCNGINDNEILSQMTKDFFNASTTILGDNASMKIIIYGTVGITIAPIAGAGTAANVYKYFDLGVKAYLGNRKLYLDFSNAIIPTTTFDTQYTSMFHSQGYGLFLENINCTIAFSSRIPSYGFYNIGLVIYNNCSIVFSGTAATTQKDRAINAAFYNTGTATYNDCNGTGSGTGAGSGYKYIYNFYNTGTATYNDCVGIGSGTGSGTGAGSGYLYFYVWGFYNTGTATYNDCKGSGTAISTFTGGGFQYQGNSAGIGYAFYNTGTATYNDCNGTGSGSGTGDAYGTSTSRGYAFYNTGTATYNDCNGTGIAARSVGTFEGDGFYNEDLGYIVIYNSCTGFGLTPDGRQAYCFISRTTSVTSITKVINCIAALGTRTNYNTTPANVKGIDIGTSANIGCHIQGNSIHNAFTSKIISPANVDNKTFTGNNITEIAISRAV